jgi:TorA maturation chaperone TorD
MINTADTVEREKMRMLAETRASLSALLDTHFLNLPDEQFVQQLYDPSFLQALESIAGEAELDADLSAGAGQMRGFLEENRNKDPEEVVEILGLDRTRLYRGVSPTYGPPPPYEAVWGAGREKSVELLQEISATYHASGLALQPDANERLDYIGVELAFIEHLAQDEASAWEDGDEQRAAELQESQRTFLHDHLGRWAPHFITKALDNAQTDFYRGHLQMLRGFLTQQAGLPVEGG